MIVEYNPFHNGHLWHITAAKRLTERDFAVAVMSGNYVQRGEPAIYDKWSRTRAALINGVDAVFELPSYYSVAAADYFARGAIAVLNAVGVVDCVCFGSECGDTAPLKEAADILLNEPAGFKAALKQSLSAGMSFAAARGAALSAEFTARGLGVPDGLFSRPNNNLGMEYIKALAMTNSSIKPFTVERVKSERVVSASAIRAMLLNGNAREAEEYMPENSAAYYKDESAITAAASKMGLAKAPHRLDGYSEYFKTYLYKARDLYKINLLDEMESCLSTPDMEEGLLNRFLRETSRHEKISETLAAVKTKRYAYTRLQRTVLHIILGITAGDMLALERQSGPPYLRLLGYRKQSEPLIREIAANATLPVAIDAAAARKRLPPFALKVFERETRDELSVPLVKI